ncbi:MAG: cyclodeaminase/cyclohydrolase family protein, partial [Dorea sp.]
MMLEKKTTEFLEVLSSAEPVPGGGGASAAVGAFASALGMMVANLTVGKKKYADVEEEIIDIRGQLEVLREELVTLTDKDAEAFEPLSRAYGLPKETQEQKEEKERVMEKALYEASIVPLQIMRTVSKVIGLLKILGEKGSRIAV